MSTTAKQSAEPCETFVSICFVRFCGFNCQNRSKNDCKG